MTSFGRLGFLLTAIAGCSTVVEHGLDEPSANEVVSALERAGLGAEKHLEEGSTPPSFRVAVGGSGAAQAIEVLRAAGLPRARRQGFAEIYGQPALIPTASEERARYLGALAGELERTLETVEGIVSARVHLVPAEVDPMAADGKPRAPARASVLLKARAGKPPLPEADVARLIAGAVPGLEPAGVAVVVAAAPEAPEGPPGLAAVGPLRVATASRSVIVGAAAGGLFVIAALAALLLVTARKLGTIQRRIGL